MDGVNEYKRNIAKEWKCLNCEVCEEDIWYCESTGFWYLRVEEHEWNPSIDGFDFQDIRINFCYNCGRKLLRHKEGGIKMYCYDEQGNELGFISCVPKKGEEHAWGEDEYVCTCEMTTDFGCRNGMIFKKVN